VTEPRFGVVESISPVEGSPLGGEAVTITGIGFGAATTVTFGRVPAINVQLVSSEQLEVVTPPAAPGAVTVTITRENMPSLVLDFVYTDLVVTVVRPDDLLSLSFQLVNLQLSAGSLTLINPGAPATIVVQLPPQHITESVYPADANFNLTTSVDPPITAVMAGGSRLAFTLPAGLASLPLNLANLLSWGSLDPVPPNPGPPGAPPTEPTGTQTAIELPYRLVLGIDSATWQHQVQTITTPTPGVYEVWRTRAAAPRAHVTWTPDLIPTPQPDPNVSPGPPVVPGALLTAADRVELASQAVALTIDALALSALGASANLQAEGLPGPLITGWHQIVSHGRDSYVRIVTPGCTAPFAPAASVVTVAERVPAASAADGTGTASAEALASYQVLVHTQLVIDYADDGSVLTYASYGKQMPLPFRSVSIVNPVTPPIKLDPETGTVLDLSGNPFPFHVVVEDLSGATADMAVPMMFIPAGNASDASTIYARARASYDLSGQLSGQPIAFVGPPSQEPTIPAAGDASVLAVNSMTFNVTTLAGVPPSHPFFPSMDSAGVALPAVSRLAGNAGTVWIGYNPTYLAAGIDPPANQGGVFADFVPPPTNLAQPRASPMQPQPLTIGIGADLAGGLSAPQLPLTGLSKTLGAVPGADDLINGNFDPTTIFAALESATLLGGIKLSEILGLVGAGAGGVPFDLSKVPALKHVQLSDGIHTSFTWNPPINQTLQNLPSLPGLTIDVTRAALSLSFESVVPLNGGNPSADVSGQLTGINLTFVSAVELDIDSLSFAAHVGQKVDLTTGKNLTISFKNNLAFLNELAKALPPNGFVDPPFLDATADGVTAGYTLGLPAIGVGIISIENISFEAALSLPFTAPLGLSVAFSTRDNPFLVTVSLIGGGGFLGIEVGAEGLRQVEGSIELGASLSVDLAIVTANVQVMAGFYFGMTTTAGGTQTNFAGFLRIGGSVDLLGILSVSIELYLQLAYSDKTFSAITGSATLTLSVQVLFATKSFTLSVQKTFTVPGATGATGAAIAPEAAVPGGPVSFDQLITLADWQTYCAAFV